MNRILFFDDQRLFGRENLIRDYGKPSCINTYFDGKVSTDYRTPFVFKTEDGKYRMLYTGKSIGSKADNSIFMVGGMGAYLAVSDDGINFIPETVTSSISAEKKVADNQLMEFEFGQEIAEILCDKEAPKEERYKLLLSTFNKAELKLNGTMMVSSDLKEWKEFPCNSWNGGAEPITGFFKKNDGKTFGILVRFNWGERRIGYTETQDFFNYTEKALCMQCDSLDDPLAEVYGMPAFNYNGIYIGFPLLYSNLKSSYSVKYFDGTMYSQLAYSFDGSHWQRSLRKNFIDDKTANSNSKMIWISSVVEKDDDDLLIYASETPYEHGRCDNSPGEGRIRIYSLRKDGFVCLKTDASVGTVLTRENLWKSGELNLNLKAEKATVAVYVSDIGNNSSGSLSLVEGYSHEDCLPFSGDSTGWIPEFKSGKKISELKGKTLAFEIKLTNGEIYSLYGDFLQLSNSEAARYRAFGMLPKEPIRF